MASSSSSFLTFSAISPPYRLSSPYPKPYISCGPRSNRGPLLRGRVLSTEAILTVQSLKRASSSSSNLDHLLSQTLSRLIKSDLLSVLRELLRQNHCHLALRVFAAARREIWYRTDYSLYAEIVSALARNGMSSEIDRLVFDLLEEEGFHAADDSGGIARLFKSLIAAERAKAVSDVYALMRREGCVPDEFLYKVLSKGMRRLGEFEVADEVERDFFASSV